MKSKFSKAYTKGFTLIELIIVIVILGVLAATAAPKYIDLESDAHTAVLKAVKASMEGASALVYGKALVKGVQGLPATGNPSDKTVNIGDQDGDGNDENLIVHYGYPRANKTDWQLLIDIDDKYGIFETTDNKLFIYVVKFGVPTTSLDDCMVIYSRATITDKATVTLNDCV